MRLSNHLLVQTREVFLPPRWFKVDNLRPEDKMIVYHYRLIQLCCD